MVKGLFVGVLVAICFVTRAQEIKMLDNEQIFTCFRQGNTGDCVSVALIKAAICVYGVNGVFKERPIDDSKTEVTLKNGKKYILTKDEFDMAKEAMRIKPSKYGGIPEVMDYATRCFAVMAKVKQDLDNIGSFEFSLDKLSHGASGRKSFFKLGLENNVVMLDQAPDYKNICGGVAWTQKHVLFVCDGYMDRYGNKVPIDPKYYGGFRLIP